MLRDALRELKIRPLDRELVEACKPRRARHAPNFLGGHAGAARHVGIGAAYGVVLLLLPALLGWFVHWSVGTTALATIGLCLVLVWRAPAPRGGCERRRIGLLEHTRVVPERVAATATALDRRCPDAELLVEELRAGEIGDSFLIVRLGQEEHNPEILGEKDCARGIASRRRHLPRRSTIDGLGALHAWAERARPSRSAGYLPRLKATADETPGNTP